MTGSPSEMILLAERCESAVGPDREIDARIDCALKGRTGFVWLGHYYNCDQLVSAGGAEVPAYSASIDSAMTLVSPDKRWRVGNQLAGRPEWTAAVGGHRCHAATAPLALCAAALRARAAS